MTPDEILYGAAGLIRKRGLAKGSFQDENGRLCALGAMRTTANPDGSTLPPDICPDTPAENAQAYRDACHALRDEIRYFASTGSGSIPAWSDMPHRTALAVAQTMYEAANRYRREHP